MTTVAMPLKRRKQRPSVAIGSVLVLVVACAGWWIASRISFVIPDPSSTTRALFSNLGDPDYQRDMRVTAIAVAWAFALGTLIGALLGLVLGLSRTARLLFEPLVIGLNGMPKIVLYPMLLPVFHLGYGSKVVMGVLFSLFPVLINVAAGVRDVPEVYWKLSRSLNASRWQTLTAIVIPAIRRPLLTGIRLAVSLATVGVVLSEFFATQNGLGRTVLRAYGTGDYADMMATILLLISVSFTLSLALWRLERKTR
ncbi:ABC transporter permease [Streptomyces sp. NPDC003442]